MSAKWHDGCCSCSLLLPRSLWIAVKITRIVLILCCCFGEKLNLFVSGGWLMWSWEKEEAKMQWEDVKTNCALYFQQLERDKREALWNVNLLQEAENMLRANLVRSRDSLVRARAADANGQTLLVLSALSTVRFSPWTLLHLLYNILKLWFVKCNFSLGAGKNRKHVVSLLLF